MKDLPQGIDPMKLNYATLNKLPKGTLRPQYDPAQLKAGIVHIGLGNFHRAHQAWYLHRLMQQGEAHDWACLLYTSPSPRDRTRSRMPSSA